MQDLKNIQTTTVNTTIFTDSKGQRHNITHSLLIRSDSEQHEYEKTAAEDLYHIFRRT